MTSDAVQESHEPLGVGEVVIASDSTDGNGAELLYRQIPEFNWDVTKNCPASLAFYPQSSDERKPSFSRSTKTSAKSAYEWHNANARSRSLSTWACSVVDVDEAKTRAVDDSAVPLNPGEKRAPGHAFVDYRKMDKGQMRLIGSQLLMKAIGRGQLYPEQGDSDSAA